MNGSILVAASVGLIFSVSLSSFAAEEGPASQSEYTGKETNTAQDKQLKAEDARVKEETQPKERPEVFKAVSDKINEQEAKGNVGGAKK